MARNFFSLLTRSAGVSANEKDLSPLAAQLSAANAIIKSHEDKLALSEKTLMDLRSETASTISGLETSLAAAKKEHADLEASMPEKIKLAAIDIAAASGIRGDATPPVGAGAPPAASLKEELAKVTDPFAYSRTVLAYLKPAK